jgi:hypothetical protein
MIISKYCGACISLALLLLLSGCGTIGPSSLERDRFDYSSTIAESWKKMMLLNIVKLRYGDTPIFLEVTSIVNQYIFETELGASAELQSGNVFGDGLFIGGKGKYADRPTITYTPLTGKKFSKSLLTPIPPHALFSLIQSGWSAEFVFSMCLSAINDLSNTSRLTHSAGERFNQLLNTLTYIQQAGGLGARLVEQGNGKSIVFFRRNLNKEFDQQVISVLELLGLNPEKRNFSLTYGSSAANDTEIAMLTRSMLDITLELAQYVEIPENHIKENRASKGRDATSIDETRSRIIVGSSKDKPEDAFLAIEYHDYWFYIKDTDFHSKRMFSFLLFLFTLAESGSQGIAPVLTLPTG